VKKIIATVAVFAVIAPNALLSAQVAQAAPDDPTTTVVPAPAGGDGPGDRQQPPAAPQAPPVPPSPLPPVPAAPVRTHEPVVTPDAPPPVQTPTPTVPQSTPTVVPTTTVEAPRVETPTVTPTPTAPITTGRPTTLVASTPLPAPTGPPTTSASASAPAATTPSTQASTGAGVPTVATPSSSPTSAGSASPAESGALNTPLTSAAPVTTTLNPTTVVTDGTTVTEVAPAIVSASASVSVRVGTPVVPQPAGVPVKSAEAIQAAKTSPAVVVDPHAPPPPPVNVTNVTNINTQITNIEQVNIHENTNVTTNNWRPARWDYVDYDPYHRPVLYNPSGEDVRYRYYYDGDYREAWVPPGERIVLDIVTAAVFPFTAVGSSFVSSGSFNGGGWTPPNDGYTGPPPPDWQPYTPVTYDNAYVNVPAANQSLFVNQVTAVGHDDTQPVGQQDSFMLDGTTLGRGQISPDGTSITLATAQKTPGVGPVTNGVDLVNMATPLAAPARDNTPYYAGALLAVAALMGGVFWWVWRRPRAMHGAGGYDPPTGPIT
jgi:hypothetical protein